jgi:hypothetical protein
MDFSEAVFSFFLSVVFSILFSATYPESPDWPNFFIYLIVFSAVFAKSDRDQS